MPDRNTDMLCDTATTYEYYNSAYDEQYSS